MISVRGQELFRKEDFIIEPVSTNLLICSSFNLIQGLMKYNSIIEVSSKVRNIGLLNYFGCVLKIIAVHRGITEN